MFEKNQIAVVIPICKESLSADEEISLKQVLRVLKDYDIYFISPQHLNYKYKRDSIKEIRFDDIWFASQRNYSEFMLQKMVYQTFIDYEYILIYQLDAFVFSDQLLDFCELGYDYIGAPWIHGLIFYRNIKNFIQYVGNGGFSLRRVSSFLRWLDNTDLSKWIKHVNEDILISAFGTPLLKISSIELSLNFAFDMDPQMCFVKNNYRLPFGCHAWRKIDLEFWRPYIERFGYHLKGVDNEGFYERYCLRYERADYNRNLLYKLTNEKIIKSYICKITKNENKSLYIWGTGFWGTHVGRIFSELKVDYDGFIDNKEECSKEYMNHPLLQGKHFLEKFSSAAVLIAALPSEEIEKQICEKRISTDLEYMTLQDIK